MLHVQTPEGYIFPFTISSWLILNSPVRVKYLKEKCPGFMVKADPIAQVSKVAFVDIACQPRRLSGLLSSAPPFSLERSVSRRQLRSNERASVSNSSSPRTRVAGSRNFVAKNNKRAKQGGGGGGGGKEKWPALRKKITIERPRRRLR